MNRKFKRTSLSELEELTPSFDIDVLLSIVGSGSGTYASPYTWEEVDQMMDAGTWKGGYVNNAGKPYNLDALIPGVTIYGTYSGGYKNSNSDHFQSFFNQFKNDVNLNQSTSGYSTNYQGNPTGVLPYCPACNNVDGVVNPLNLQGVDFWNNSPVTPLGYFILKKVQNHDPSCPWSK